MSPASRQCNGLSVKKLLDAAFLEPFLAECPGIRWPDGALPSRFHMERLWPVAEDRVAIEWSFELGTHGRCSLFATPTRPTDTMVRDTCNLFHSSGVLQGLRLMLNPWPLLIHTPDQDPTLSQMSTFLDRPDSVRDALRADGVIDSAEPAGADVRLVSYRARRRATLRFHLPGPPEALVGGKTFRDGRGERILRWHAQLGEHVKRASGGEVGVAEPIGYIEVLRLALFVWCGDATGSRRPRSAGDAIRALAHLHSAPPDGLAPFIPDDELVVLPRWRSVVAAVDPAVGRLLDGLIRALRAAVPPDGAATATIHRDFHSRQVISNNGQIVVLDLDTVSRGDPALDVGNLLAHLWLDALQRDQGDVRRFAEDAVRLLAEYRGMGGRLTRDSLRWYWASALIRLGAIHAFRTATAQCSPALWRQAAELLHASDRGDRSPKPGDDRTAVLGDVDPILAEVSG